MDNFNKTFCQPVNLVPHFWNYKIVDKHGNPDLTCIAILSELFGWFRSLPESKTYYSTGNSLPELVNGKLAISYDFLEAKLNIQKERIRRNLVKLENSSIITRFVKNIAIKGGSRINQLYISIDEEFFKSCFRDPKLDIRVRHNKYVSSGLNNSCGGTKSTDSTDNVDNVDCTDSTDSNEFASSARGSGEYIRKKLFIKNRSINRSTKKSNFCKNNLEENSQNFESSKSQKNLGSTKCLNINNNHNHWKFKKRYLADFYPLSEEDCSSLQSTSGREFSLNAMNEILLDMSKRLTNKLFDNRRVFLKYMSKCLSYEMRDAVKISDINFKIRANQSEEDKTDYAKEQYLSKIEYSLQVSPEMHFKKKLAAVLGRIKAYDILTSYKKLTIEQNGVGCLVLGRDVNLTQHDKEMILSQLQASHAGIKGNTPIEKLNILIKEASLGLSSSPSPSLTLDKNLIQNKNQNQSFKSENQTKNEQLNQTELPKNIWGKVRASLINYYGKNGEGMDKSWFSKLSASIDTDNRNIILQAPTNFIKDWVQTQYSHLIDKICQEHNYSLEVV